MGKLKMFTMVNVYCPFANGVEHQHQHVTMSFSDVVACEFSSDLLQGPLPMMSEIIGVEYWEKANVTVAILEPSAWREARAAYDSVGLTYLDYAFRPHVTLSRNNRIAEYANLIGHAYHSLDVIVKIKEFK